MSEQPPLRTFMMIILGLLTVGLIVSVIFYYVWPDVISVPDQNSAQVTATPLVEDASQPTATRILHRGKLRVGVRVNSPPFGDTDEHGQIVGFDIDLARELAQRWLGNADKLELIKVGTSDRIPRLVAGEVDLLIAAMPQKREREAFIDFSQTYFMGGQTLLAPESSAVQTLADLQNKPIGVLQGSTSGDILLNVASKQNIILTVQSLPESAAAIAALQSGQVAALAADSVVLSQLAAKNPGFRLSGGRLTQEPYAIGLRQGDSALRELVNFTLQDMKNDGVYDQIYQRWFPTDTPYALEHLTGQPAYSLDKLPVEPASDATSTVEKILKRGRLVIGIQQNFQPFSTQDRNGQWIGFDIDLAHEFAQRWLGDANAVDLMPAEPNLLVNYLVTGGVDLVAGALTQQRDWAAKIDFSQSYLGPPIVSLPVNIGLPQNDSTFRKLVNTTLQEMKTDGKYDTILARWFGEGTQYSLEIIPGDASYLVLPFQNRGAPPRVSAATVSTISRIREHNNVLTAGVATDAPPFGLLDENTQATGFDVDLIRAIAQEWGIEVKFVPVTPADRIDKLVAGAVDILAAAMPRRKEESEKIDFSQTYFLQGMNLLATSSAGVHSIQELDKHTVGVIEAAAVDQLRAYAEVNHVGIEVKSYPTMDTLVAALQVGEVAAILVNNIALPQLAEGAEPLIQIAGPFASEPYGLGLPVDDSYFDNLVNITLQTLKQRGVYDQIYHKWFGAAATPYSIEIFPGFWPYTFAQSPVTLDKPVRSKVDEILAKRKFVAGVFFDFKPFGFLEQDNQPAGFDVDILREFAKRWLGDVNAVEFVPVTSANRFPMLAAGEVDILASAMPHHREWDESIDFSQTYFTGGQGLLVRVDSGISKLPDLNNKLIAAIEGSAAIENIQAIAASQSITVEILRFQEYPQALAALKAGQVAALTATQAALEQIVQENPDLVVLGERLVDEPYGLGIPNYDSRFQNLVNFTLQAMKLDGAYDRLYQKWFPASAPFAIEISPGQSYFDLDLIPMVHIPAGEFLRGNANGFPDEKVEKKIQLDEFYIDQYEVTNRQYAECVQAGRCTQPHSPRSVNFANYYGDSAFGNYPVIWLSWDDAATYCKFRGKRLPSEAEWEKAARGPQGSLFPWGDEIPTNQANFNYAAGDVAPVGVYPGDLSGYGVYDMAGNVREWVADWYQWDYYPTATALNPTGPVNGVTKVLRGGSWNDVSTYLRSTVRKNFLRESVDSNLGFRCASSTFPPQ